MISVVGVFDGLLRDGPTPERVRAAVPSLAPARRGRGRARSAVLGRGGGQRPVVAEGLPGRRRCGCCELTTEVELSTFDDPGWRDAMERARDRGISAAQQLVDRAIELGTNLIGLVAAAGVLAVLHPVLLPLLVLAVVPIGWAAVRSARLRLPADAAADRRLAAAADARRAARRPRARAGAAGVHRARVPAGRDPAAAGHLHPARRSGCPAGRSATTLLGTALSGLATGLTYAVLLWLLWTGRMELAAGGAAAYAINVGIGKLTELAFTANRVFEQGLYFADFQGFCELSRSRAEPLPGGPAPRGLRGDPAGRRDLQLSRRRTPGRPRRQHDAAPRRDDRAGRRERLRQIHPGRAARRPLPPADRHDQLGRRRRRPLRPGHGPRARRGGHAGTHPMAALRAAQHHHRTVRPERRPRQVHDAARAGDAHDFVDGAAAASTTPCCPATSPTAPTCPAGSGSGWR